VLIYVLLLCMTNIIQVIFPIFQQRRRHLLLSTQACVVIIRSVLGLIVPCTSHLMLYRCLVKGYNVQDTTRAMVMVMFRLPHLITSTFLIVTLLELACQAQLIKNIPLQDCICDISMPIWLRSILTRICFCIPSSLHYLDSLELLPVEVSD